MLPLSDFHKDSSKMFGVRSQCKDCASIIRSKKQKKIPKKIRKSDSSEYYLTMSSKSQRDLLNFSSRNLGAHHV